MQTVPRALGMGFHVVTRTSGMEMQEVPRAGPPGVRWKSTRGKKDGVAGGTLGVSVGCLPGEDGGGSDAIDSVAGAGMGATDAGGFIAIDAGGLVVFFSKFVL
ncbi:hypothetical protein NDU88_000511 [Pleurodeles waltl]|uniref:Uncharacterized protein n=1 Tax=Pleurodeles waltl TaxID=8319 RepID=A0AAV7MM98_PLEWA|nr:hypothetical protein NDU88_000511 [Pleurodeles waltl]